MTPTIKQVVDLHRAQLLGIVELRGVRRLRKIYDESRAELVSKLKDLERAHRGQTFQAQHLRSVLAQVEDGLSVFNRKFGKHLKDGSRIASAVGSRHLIDGVKKMEKRFTGATPVIQTEQAAVLRGVFSKVEPSLLNRHRKSVQLYTKPVVGKIKAELARSIVQGETVDEAVDRVAGVGGVFDRERWRAERIVRTELSYSYHAAKQETMREMQTRDVPDLKKRIVETFDNRTGEDSKQLHGQTVDVDKPFKWKMDDGTVVEFMMPPNRPNDRGTVIPWRPGWEAPAALEEPGPVAPRQPPSP